MKSEQLVAYCSTFDRTQKFSRCARVREVELRCSLMLVYTPHSRVSKTVLTYNFEGIIMTFDSHFEDMSIVR
jgi:hypothetical protein